MKYAHVPVARRQTIRHRKFPSAYRINVTATQSQQCRFALVTASEVSSQDSPTVLQRKQFVFSYVLVEISAVYWLHNAIITTRKKCHKAIICINKMVAS